MCIRTKVFGLGLIALLACGACATGGQKAQPSDTPTATSAPEPAGDAEGTKGDVAAGAAFYAASGCASCHGEDGGGGFQGPGIRGGKANDLLSFMDGTAMHSGGAVDNVTAENAANLEAYLR